MLNQLNHKQYIAIVKSDEYRQLLTQMCKRIVITAESAPNEATIENNFDCELFAFFREVFEPIGFAYNPVKEKAVSTSRHITKGRTDTAVGALIIEFKQPAALSNEKKREKAMRQISDYLEGIDNENDIPLVGFVTDGIKGSFVVYSDKQLHYEAFTPLSFNSLDRIIRTIVSLGLTALNSKNLVDNFCNPPANDGVAFGLLSSLFSALENMTERTQMLFNEWKELFNLAHDDISKQQAIIDRKKSLENLLHTRFNHNDEQYKALYALQTAYAIIVKTVAYRIISQVRYNDTLVDFDALKQQSSDALRTQLAALEDGAVFRDYGITNLLEGDFFSWYCVKEQWTNEIANNITKIFSVLSLYSDKAVLNKTERSQDFFKALYESMMPTAVRRSLGEYYTKKWLAKQVVDEAIQISGADNWRGLDPCCGSGTFVTVMIDNLIQEMRGSFSDSEILDAVLHRIKGIDLNPIAVLTARVNYFINISGLISDSREIEIPIYLGDSSYVPQKIEFDGIPCLEYSINTLRQPIAIVVPQSMIKDSLAFSKSVTSVELHIKNLDKDSAFESLISLVNEVERTDRIKEKLFKLASDLVELERNKWNGIWARIITNFLTTANLGCFDIIVGNPPWVDWKNLPSGYRNRIKTLCISRKLFSGDRVTGGINLNICALISNVSAENWLNNSGVLAFLMPETLVQQPSYEGFRNFYLSNGNRLYFCKFTNWTKSGHPFKPVTQKFLTFFISHKEQNYAEGVQTDWFVLKEDKNIEGIEELDTNDYFDKTTSLLATCHPEKNVFTQAGSHVQLDSFKNVAGISSYTGREGIEFYPQELMVFTLSGLFGTKTCTALKNIQVKKSKYHVPQQNVLIETEFLHPLIRGVDIKPFHIKTSGNIVPFPYEETNPKYPIEIKELTKRAPHLASYYQKNKDLLISQTGYSERIIGAASEFYALARVGAYSYAEHYVVFRDNTKWGAAVVSAVETEWGGLKRPLFQNHAVSICQDTEGNYITLDESHFICGILNAPIVARYVLQSSDSRSFPIRPRINIPKYNKDDVNHTAIVDLSQEAHDKYDDADEFARIMHKLNEIYLRIISNT